MVWSPDGRFLFGWTAEARHVLAAMSIDGSSPTTTFTVQGNSVSHWTWQRQAP